VVHLGFLRTTPNPATEQPIAVAMAAGQEQDIWLTQGRTGTCSVYDPAGEPVPLLYAQPGSMTVAGYDLASSFTAPSEGTYTVVCAAPFSNVKITPTTKVAPLVAGIVCGTLIIVASWIGALSVFMRRLAWLRRTRQ